MTKEALVFEVSDSSYGKYVLLNSHKVPVVVTFEGAWSEHCMIVADMFSSLAREFAESFVFAKVDIDANPELKEKYNIENVPTLAVFIDGEPVRFEVGVLKEDEARALLRDFGIFNESDDMRQRARVLHIQGETPQAITLLAEAMKKDPANTRIALDMVQVFIDMAEYGEAASLLGRLPQADRESEMGKSLSGQLWIIEQAGKRQLELAKEQGPGAERRYEILRFRFEGGLTIRDIANRLGLEPACTHKEYARAREEFRAALLEVVALHSPGLPGEVERESVRLLGLLS